MVREEVGIPVIRQMLESSGEKSSVGKLKGALRDLGGGGDPTWDVRWRTCGRGGDISPDTSRLGRSELCGWEGRSFPGRGGRVCKGPGGGEGLQYSRI